MIYIDIDGPDGNAFALMGYATRYGKQLGWTKEEIDALISDMQSADYDHLVKVFQEAFENYVQIVSEQYDED